MKKLESECVVLCNTCLLYYVQILIHGHYIAKDKFLPLLGRKIGKVFLPWPQGKNTLLLFTDIIIMTTSITLVMILICFVFQKAWLFHFFASETSLFPLYSMRTVPFVAFANLL